MDNNKQKDIEFMKEWCLTILEFMAAQYSEKDTISEGRSYKDFFQRKIDLIKNLQRKDKRGWKMLYNDTTELARHEALNKDNLNKVLKERFGNSLIDEEKSLQGKVFIIRNRGKLLSDEEFYLVKSYVDEIPIDNTKEIELLDSLLSTYENSKK